MPKYRLISVRDLQQCMVSSHFSLVYEKVFLTTMVLRQRLVEIWICLHYTNSTGTYTARFLTHMARFLTHMARFLTHTAKY